MKKIALSLLLVLLTTHITLAQKKVFFESTIIEQETEDPVNEASITIEEKGFTTLTDDTGHFSFNEVLEEGSYVVSIRKEGFEPKVFLLEQKEGFKIKLKETISIVITKKEAKRRKDEAKDKEKEAEERMKEIERERERKEKELKKLQKQLGKGKGDDDPIATSELIPVNEPKEDPIIEEEVISPNQIKYAEVLGVDISEITNKSLYNFIDDWIGTPYLMGGETKNAIDCSSFSQRLYISAYDRMYLERTAQKQFDSEFIELFKNKKYLEEGDLIFFGKDPNNITHVGVYLHNNKFVHSTSARADGPSGVKISDISNPYWSKKFLSAGRRQPNN